MREITQAAAVAALLLRRRLGIESMAVVASKFDVGGKRPQCATPSLATYRLLDGDLLQQ